LSFFGKNRAASGTGGGVSWRGGMPDGLSGIENDGIHGGRATGINIAKEKAAPRTLHTLHRFHGTKQQDADYSSFLVLITLRPR
jgi:hypothetical protein